MLLADGTGAVVCAALGSPFPPAVYIGNPGWKEAGGRRHHGDPQRRILGDRSDRQRAQRGGYQHAKVGSDALAKAGVVYDGLKALGGGAILAGMLLGAMVAFMIDKCYYLGGGYCAAGAVLSFIGLIHGEQVAWAAGPGVALGYPLAAVVYLAFSFGSTPAPAQMPDEHAPAAARIPEQAGPAEVTPEPAR